MEIDWKLNESLKNKLKSNTTSLADTKNVVSTQSDEQQEASIIGQAEFSHLKLID